MARINQNLSDITEDDMGGGQWTAWEQGEYRMMVVGSEYKATRNGDGHYLNLELTCLDGERHDQKKFDILVLEHPNQDTTKIARAKLKELAIACGHPSPDHISDSEELHGIPVRAYITKKKSKDPQYGDASGFENRIAGYKACEETARSAPAARPQAASQEPAHVRDDIPF